MSKRLIAAALLALITTPIIYGLSLREEYELLSFSIYVTICLALSMLAALAIIIRYWVSRKLNVYWWMYIALLLAGNLAAMYLLSLPVDLLTFLFSPLALGILLLIGAMILVLMAWDRQM